MRKLVVVTAVAGLVLASCGQVDDQGRSPTGAGQEGGSQSRSDDSASPSVPLTPDTTIPPGTTDMVDLVDSQPVPDEREPSVLVSGGVGANFSVTFPMGWLDGQGDGFEHRFLRPGETQSILGSVAVVSVFKNAPELRPDLIGTDALTREGRIVKVYDDSQKGFPPVTLLHVDMGDFIVGLAVTNSSATLVEELLAGFRVEEVT